MKRTPFARLTVAALGTVLAIPTFSVVADVPADNSHLALAAQNDLHVMGTVTVHSVTDLQETLGGGDKQFTGHWDSTISLNIDEAPTSDGGWTDADSSWDLRYREQTQLLYVATGCGSTTVAAVASAGNTFLSNPGTDHLTLAADVNFASIATDFDRAGIGTRTTNTLACQYEDASSATSSFGYRFFAAYHRCPFAGDQLFDYVGLPTPHSPRFTGYTFKCSDNRVNPDYIAGEPQGLGSNSGATESIQVTGTLSLSCPSAGSVSVAPINLLSIPRAASDVCPHHYVVDMRAWIPFAEVVDPIIPTDLPYAETVVPSLLKMSPNCNTITSAALTAGYVRSWVHGDGHATFEGTFRMRQTIEFDFDGRSITNFKQSYSDVNQHAGISTRTKTYYGVDNSILDTCTMTAQAQEAWTATQTGDVTFNAGYAGSVPLVPFAPNLTQQVLGAMSSDGSMSIYYTTTWFPNHGIRVTRDGQPIGEVVTNDVTCFSQAQVLGVPGLSRLLLGLESEQSGILLMNPAGGQSADVTSPLCSLG